MITVQFKTGTTSFSANKEKVIAGILNGIAEEVSANKTAGEICDQGVQIGAWIIEEDR